MHFAPAHLFCIRQLVSFTVQILIIRFFQKMSKKSCKGHFFDVILQPQKRHGEISSAG